MTVRQLRFVVEVDDFDAALRFYRDALGMTEELAVSGDGDARVTILDAGRATLELVNVAQRRFIDDVEAGRDLGSEVRVALEVDDTPAMADRLRLAGADALGAPTLTPWRSLNARLRAPDGLQLTLFQDVSGTDQSPVA